MGSRRNALQSNLFFAEQANRLLDVYSCFFGEKTAKPIYIIPTSSVTA
jgi:hypothetical protein